MTDSLRSLWKEAFGDSDQEIENFFAYAFRPENVLVLPGGKGAIYWLDCSFAGQKAAYLYAFAVARPCRGQGLGSQLLAGAETVLAQRGYCAAFLVPGEPQLRSFYAQRGYRPYSFWEDVEVEAGPPVALEELSPGAYQERRQAFLPENALEQSACLRFFATQVRFYEGSGFLVAARVYDRQVFAPEVLGKAPLAGICGALGGKKGVFRLAGRGSLGAMAKALGEWDLPPEGYLGWALD